jgi:hypothetical protein
MKLVSVFMINNSVYISVSLKIAQLYTEKNHTELVRVLRERENNCYVDIGGGYNRLFVF